MSNVKIMDALSDIPSEQDVSAVTAIKVKAHSAKAKCTNKVGNKSAHVTDRFTPSALVLTRSSLVPRKD